jgi:acetyl esterase/lipase
MRTVLWAYSGRRRYLEDPAFATCSVTNHVSPAFPPALITAGTVDPLRPHSELMVKLERVFLARMLALLERRLNPPHAG